METKVDRMVSVSHGHNLYLHCCPMRKRGWSACVVWLYDCLGIIKSHYVIFKYFHLLFVPTKGCIHVVLQAWLHAWGLHHRVSSVLHLQESSALRIKELLVFPLLLLSCSSCYIFDLSWSICAWYTMYISYCSPHFNALLFFPKCCYLFFLLPLFFISLSHL